MELHGRGRWFEPSTAHQTIQQVSRLIVHEREKYRSQCATPCGQSPGPEAHGAFSFEWQRDAVTPQPWKSAHGVSQPRRNDTGPQPGNPFGAEFGGLIWRPIGTGNSHLAVPICLFRP